MRKYFKVNRLDHNVLEAFLGSGYTPAVGDILEILDIDFKELDKKDAHPKSMTGILKVSHKGNTYKFNEDEAKNKWCFVTFGMLCERWGLQEMDETDYVNLSMKAKRDSTKSYLAEYGTVSLEDRYNAWVIENIHVYDLFCKFALQAIATGRKKISHWLIVNRLRWEVEIETKSLCVEDKEFKISNDYIALLARDFIKDHPEHSEVFNLKQMKRV